MSATTRVLATPVVPDEALVALVERATGAEEGAQEKDEVLVPFVQAHLAIAGEERVAMQDDDAAALAAGKALQATEEVDFLARIEALAEAAEPAERPGIAEDERACPPGHQPAEAVPEKEP